MNYKEYSKFQDEGRFQWFLWQAKNQAATASFSVFVLYSCWIMNLNFPSSFLNLLVFPFVLPLAILCWGVSAHRLGMLRASGINAGVDTSGVFLGNSGCVAVSAIFYFYLLHISFIIS